MRKIIKNKNINIVIVGITIFSMVALYAFIPLAKAASLTDASDTLSDSDVGATAVTNTLDFTTGVALVATDYIEVTFPSAFGDVLVANITCPAGTTKTAQSTEKARCTSDAGTAAGALTVIVVLDNPSSAGSQIVNISTKTSGDVEIETVDVMVAIIDDVTVTATVSSTLTFEINPLPSGTDVNGTATTLSSATTTLAFGTLVNGVSTILGQQLRVITNADDGFTVTVEQDHNLISESGSDIDSFDDGTVVAPKAWEAPTGTLDSEETYGHMGLTSEDGTLTAGDDFGANLWQGFNGTAVTEVMYHNGPADGSTAEKGLTQVAYQIQISALQEAGDYTNTLTYICTPTF